ncbi:MAG: hypothetical protein K6G22_04940 [Lachnospiraceae bacterium]|nr:hypothetical protein [Lachnospiraceae bacterium]
MADTYVWRVQSAVAIIVLIISAFIFIRVLHKIKRFIAVVPEDERIEMARLQEETFGVRNAALNADTLRKLTELWFAILVGVQFMYEIFSEVYRHFALGLYTVTVSRNEITGEAYTSLYNLSHGFKYQGLLVALILGVIMTAIFLDDATLKLTAILAASVYLLSSIVPEMTTLNILGRDIGIVWSSVIFHILDTLGMAVFAIYLRIRYRGI